MTMSQETRGAVRAGAIRSAAAILPGVFKTIGGLPSAVLEVGAGEGHWGIEAERLGVPFVKMLDAQPWVGIWNGRDGEHHYEVEGWNAEHHDALPTPRGTQARWPLSICLETAEHISPPGAAYLLAELCRVSKLILWSAAIPGQGGDGHVNERWATDWAEGFDSNGWHLEDPLRDELWECADVEPWYRQNLLLARPGRTDQGDWPRNLVDPVTWAHHRGVAAP